MSSIPKANATSQPEIIRMIESAVARNLLDYVHAAQSVAPVLGADATPCAGGVAAFMGIGSPLTTVKGVGPEITDLDIDMVEDWFRRHGAVSVLFELAPWNSQQDPLSRRGYTEAGSEDVVVRFPPFDAPAPLHRVESVDQSVWPELMCRANEVPDIAQWHGIVSACAALPHNLRFAVVDDNGSWMACAQICPAEGVALFANDATLRSAERRGAHTAAIRHRLRQSAQLGFACAIAEVAPGSTSERNYLRCGFHIAYTRTHYSRRIR